jgi:hypothetical protein
MKTGKTLSALAAEIERQAKTKIDYTASTVALKMEDDARLTLRDRGTFNVNGLAHEQIATRLSIPRPYYDRMRTTSPALLANNVNHWFDREPEKRMIRTLDGNVRAFLSNRYRPLDNYDLAEAVLPVFQSLRLSLRSCELTERRLYLKAVFPDITAKVPVVGDIVAAGVMISNSEVGFGSISILPLIETLRCTNGMVANDAALRRHHVGRGQKGGDDDRVAEFFSDKTRRLDDAAFFSKVQDVIRGTTKTEVFERLVARLGDAAKDRIEGDVQEAVEVVGERFEMNKEEKGGVLRHLIDGGDLSRYGLLNAVTRMSQDVEDYDRASEFEKAGGKILELPKSEWKTIATATA